MSQALQRIWEGPDIVGTVDIGGGPLSVELTTSLPMTLQDLADTLELALQAATGIGWTVSLSSDYVLQFFPGFAFDWTQAGGFGDFWGIADFVAQNRAVGTAWTAAKTTRYTIEMGLPVLVVRRVLSGLPSAIVGSSVLDSHLERDVSIRLHTEDGDEIVSLALDGPWVYYAGDNSQWTPDNLDGFVILRPIQKTLQAPRAISPRSGAFMVHNLRCIDVLTEVF